MLGPPPTGDSYRKAEGYFVLILSPGGKIAGIKALFSAKTIFEWGGTSVFPLVHPNGYWRSPSMSKAEYLSILRWYIEQIESS